MRDKLLVRLQAEGLDSMVPSVLVPTETVSEMKGGKKRVVQRKIYPGYIMVEMVLDDEGDIPDDVWFLIRETGKVGDFVGGDRNKPVPMADKEVEQVLQGMRQEAGDEVPELSIAFKVGERVKVNEGPFESYNGFVDEVNAEKGLVRVIVSIFGRETPVELEYWQVEPS